MKTSQYSQKKSVFHVNPITSRIRKYTCEYVFPQQYRAAACFRHTRTHASPPPLASAAPPPRRPPLPAVPPADASSLPSLRKVTSRASRVRTLTLPSADVSSESRRLTGSSVLVLGQGRSGGVRTPLSAGARFPPPRARRGRRHRRARLPPLRGRELSSSPLLLICSFGEIGGFLDFCVGLIAVRWHRAMLLCSNVK